MPDEQKLPTVITLQIPELDFSIELKEYAIVMENEIRELIPDEPKPWTEHTLTGGVTLKITGKRL